MLSPTASIAELLLLEVFPSIMIEGTQLTLELANASAIPTAVL
jgi:hypothetical protein